MKKVFLVIAVLSVLTAATAAQAMTWETAVNNASNATYSMRSLALAQQAGNNSFYYGYIQYGNGRDVVRASTTSPYTQLNNRGGSSLQPKGIATDDRGYVYVGNRLSGSSDGQLTVHNANLGTLSNVLVPSITNFGGIATYKSGLNYFVYASSEADGRILRYNVTDVNNITLDTTFGVGGTYTLSANVKSVLRGLTVANDGSIFVTSRDDGKLYKISADLTSVSSANIARAMDVALYNGNAYVTSYNGAMSAIGVFNTNNLSLVENITIGTLDGNPYSRGTAEGWAGIDIGQDGRIWMTDQLYGDKQDRLLVSSALSTAPQAVPEPATLLGFGLPMLMVGLGKLRSLKK